MDECTCTSVIGSDGGTVKIHCFEHAPREEDDEYPSLGTTEDEVYLRVHSLLMRSDSSMADNGTIAKLIRKPHQWRALWRLRDHAMHLLAERVMAMRDGSAPTQPEQVADAHLLLYRLRDIEQRASLIRRRAAHRPSPRAKAPRPLIRRLRPRGRGRRVQRRAVRTSARAAPSGSSDGPSEPSDPPSSRVGGAA